MSNFSLMAFELDLAGHFFKYKEDEDNSFEGFNIFHYLMYLLYKDDSFCGLCKGWKEMRLKVGCKEEMLKQLDVKLLLQRFNYLEKVADYVVSSNLLSEGKFYRK